MRIDRFYQKLETRIDGLENKLDHLRDDIRGLFILQKSIQYQEIAREIDCCQKRA